MFTANIQTTAEPWRHPRAAEPLSAWNSCPAPSQLTHQCQIFRSHLLHMLLVSILTELDSNTYSDTYKAIWVTISQICFPITETIRQQPRKHGSRRCRSPEMNPILDYRIREFHGLHYRAIWPNIYWQHQQHQGVWPGVLNATKCFQMLFYAKVGRVFWWVCVRVLFFPPKLLSPWQEGQLYGNRRPTQKFIHSAHCV